MLVVRRKAGESIFIGDGIEVVILETGPTQVKLGITAPREISVLRSEVRQIQDANLAAACQAPPESVEGLLRKLRQNSNPLSLPRVGWAT